MKKLIFGVSLFSLVLVVLLAYSSHAFANDRFWPKNHDRDNDHFNRIFNPDKQLSESACGSHLGRPLVDVTENVRNDADSGFAGNWWAFDYYTRHIQIWQTAPASTESAATNCALVTYDGQFYAVPGQNGPGDADTTGPTIDSPVNGPLSGGYVGTFNGNFALSTWPTHGNVGTVDYHCNIAGTCPGYVDWIAQYFPGYSNFAQPWWGWQYKGGSHGTWTNAINIPQASSGNIL